MTLFKHNDNFECKQLESAIAPPRSYPIKNTLFFELMFNILNNYNINYIDSPF